MPALGMVQNKKFQFTHPGRGATFRRVLGITISKVSIHAPREGCDTRAV